MLSQNSQIEEKQVFNMKLHLCFFFLKLIIFLLILFFFFLLHIEHTKSISSQPNNLRELVTVTFCAHCELILRRVHQKNRNICAKQIFCNFLHGPFMVIQTVSSSLSSILELLYQIPIRSLSRSSRLSIWKKWTK